MPQAHLVHVYCLLQTRNQLFLQGILVPFIEKDNFLRFLFFSFLYGHTMKTPRLHYEIIEQCWCTHNVVLQSKRIFTLVPPVCQMWYMFLKILRWYLMLIGTSHKHSYCINYSKHFICVNHLTLIAILWGVGLIIILTWGTKVIGCFATPGLTFY